MLDDLKLNEPASRGPDELILEGIVTTSLQNGNINISPMGPVVDRELRRIRFRPFSTSRTYKNLSRTRKGVFHITDDVDLLVRSALNLPYEPELEQVPGFGQKYLVNACRWYAFEVSEIDASEERVEVECSVVKKGVLRDFLGWNRASNAVLEATILATRVGFLAPQLIEEELRRLRLIVEKTASQRERDAFQLVTQFIEQEVTKQPHATETAKDS